MTLALNLNIAALVDLTEMMRGHVPYGWGHKIKPQASPAEFLVLGKRRGSDCSNWVRWAMYHISGGILLLPDGSVNQHDRVAQMAANVGASGEPYEMAGRKDGVLRLCGFAPAGSEAGHIWFALDGLTSECHGRNAHGDGVDRRPWDTPVLRRPATWCYALTAPSPDRDLPAPAAAPPPGAANPPGAENLPRIVLPGEVEGDGPLTAHVFTRPLAVEVKSNGALWRREENAAALDSTGHTWMLVRDMERLLPLGIEGDPARTGTLTLVMNPARGPGA